ncbi:unnamed protein product [Cylicocyclus nassatus]|uniref:Uncharacterized protein n=1 Tax=Cylicocyclus nassatus TaxID=53992 RepID=A0AA36DU87_CYLNA|nr:unnamed protein product [Cylicocyclus nassatus]
MGSIFYLEPKDEKTANSGKDVYGPCSSSEVSSMDSNTHSPHVSFNNCNDYYEKESPAPRRIGFKQRASQVIFEIPVEHLRRMKDTEGIGSISRETQHFSNTTTMHGPKRIFTGKRFAKYFWILMMFGSGLLLLYQVGTLVSMYFRNPIVSQVSFLISENGMQFPMVTICNFNSVKKSYIKKLNETGDFSVTLLDYLIQSLMDTEALYGNSDRAELHVGERALQVYQKQHPNFTFEEFFYNAGFNCSETMKLCSFAGRQFDCCKYTQAKLTNLGKCQTLDLRAAKEWFQKQVVAGVNAGLQLILDAHMEEQFDGTGDDIDAVFTNAYENGFRYYVHAPDTIPYLVSEGISVSPGMRVYSAISTSVYVLLSPEEWGNCTNEWPEKYATDLPYSAVNCKALCNANFMYDRCGCAPFAFNIDEALPTCTPYETVQCIDQIRVQTTDGTDHYHRPLCAECKLECSSLFYHAYNSYGHGFSQGALKKLSRKNPKWSKAHMRSNFLTLNVFFRDMAHTEYRQRQDTSLTQILSDIGGNMGMFLGMSLITVTEISLFISKIGWIAFSKKRRDYLYNKKQRELEHEKQLEETVSAISQLRTRKNGSIGIGDSFRRLKMLSRRIHDSISAKSSHVDSPPLEKVEAGTCTDLEEAEKEKKKSMDNGVIQNGYANGVSEKPEMIELKIDLLDLKRHLTKGTPLSIKRRRANTAPPAPRGSKNPTMSTTVPCSKYSLPDEQLQGEAL